MWLSFLACIYTPTFVFELLESLGCKALWISLVRLASRARGNTQEPHAQKGFHFWLNKVHTCISHGSALAPVLKFLVQSAARTCKMHFHFALHPTGSVAGPAICFIFYGRYTKWSVTARCHRWQKSAGGCVYGCPHHYTVSPAMAKGTFPFPTVQLTIFPGGAGGLKKKKCLPRQQI